MYDKIAIQLTHEFGYTIDADDVFDYLVYELPTLNCKVGMRAIELLYEFI